MMSEFPARRASSNSAGGSVLSCSRQLAAVALARLRSKTGPELDALLPSILDKTIKGEL